MSLTRHITIGLALAALALSFAASTDASAASRWTPGSAYWATEEEADNYLERKFDHAYCDGIPRFGHRGDEFRVLDCTFYLNDVSCYDTRFRAVKGSRRSYFRLKLIRLGDCY